MKNNHKKRYFVSSIITFVSVFLVSFGTELGDITNNIEAGIILGAFGVAIRAGVKAVFEYFIKETF